jgi:hypothetical protein
MAGARKGSGLTATFLVRQRLHATRTLARFPAAIVIVVGGGGGGGDGGNDSSSPSSGSNLGRMLRSCERAGSFCMLREGREYCHELEGVAAMESHGVFDILYQIIDAC